MNCLKTTSGQRVTRTVADNKEKSHCLTLRYDKGCRNDKTQSRQERNGERTLKRKETHLKIDSVVHSLMIK